MGREAVRSHGLGVALNKSKQQLGRFALTSVAIAALALGAVDSRAVGLGRLSVQSNLGETLRAEIDITSLTAEEAANLKVHVASADAYRAAGVDYNVVLPSTQAALLRRADGRPFLRLTSDKVVQEPFVDVILELAWASGRLVREYTLLFDPPSERVANGAQTPAPAVVTAPVFSTPAPMAAATPAAPPAPFVPAAPPVPAPSAREVAAPQKPVAKERAVKPAAEAVSPAPASAPDTYTVRSGDTLTGIASRKRTTGVSLDQMLVALYRGNPQAFVGDNINRLKSGVVLGVPSAETASAVDRDEARKLIVAQSADFGSFRQKLAGAAPQVQTDVATRKDEGKVQAKVHDAKGGEADAPDKLTLSKAASAAATTSPEARLSGDKAKQDAAARVAELSKNVEDLKKLSGAAAVVKETPAAASVPTAPGLPVLTAAPAAADVASNVAQAASQPEPAASAALAAVAAEPASVAAPKPAAASQPDVPAVPATGDEPSFLSELIENNLGMLMAGGAAVLALLGFGVYRSRRPKVDAGETSFLESRLQPDSFFGATGGQRIDTREAAGGAASSMNYSLSQLDAIGDVDPVQEAEVYLAYGRDLQAEEILKEALRGTPERMAIRMKLLEVYAKRRDTKGFEVLAKELYVLTNGEGEDWPQAQVLGLEIDPGNPLYQPGSKPEVEEFAEDNEVMQTEPLGVSTMPQSVLPTPSKFVDSKPLEEVDFQLDLDEQPAVADDLDLTPSVSFDLDEGSPAEQPAEVTVPDEKPAFEPASDEMFDLDEPEVKPQLPEPGADSPLEFDLSDISLDLDEPEVAAAAEVDALPDVKLEEEADQDDPGDPLARKLELAEEFRQIGDVEGARDLLEEVVANAEGALKSKAQALLKDLD
jgi:pilus assembly protein FimV